jgi:hypothetical protein
VYREEWYRRQRDVVYCVLALDLFWQAVSIVQKRVPDGEAALAPAVSAFANAVPSLRALRDAIAHFDECDFGEGRRPPVDNPVGLELLLGIALLQKAPVVLKTFLRRSSYLS